MESYSRGSSPNGKSYEHGMRAAGENTSDSIHSSTPASLHHGSSQSGASSTLRNHSSYYPSPSRDRSRSPRYRRERSRGDRRRSYSRSPRVNNSSRYGKDSDYRDTRTPPSLRYRSQSRERSHNSDSRGRSRVATPLHGASRNRPASPRRSQSPPRSGLTERYSQNSRQADSGRNTQAPAQSGSQIQIRNSYVAGPNIIVHGGGGGSSQGDQGSSKGRDNINRGNDRGDHRGGPREHQQPQGGAGGGGGGGDSSSSDEEDNGGGGGGGGGGPGGPGDGDGDSSGPDDQPDDDDVDDEDDRPRRRGHGIPYPPDIDPFYLSPTGKEIPLRNPQITTGKVSAWQYHEQYRKTFSKSWKIFIVSLLLECLFPDPEGERRLAIKAWQEACDSDQVSANYGYDDLIISNVSKNHPQDFCLPVPLDLAEGAADS